MKNLNLLHKLPKAFQPVARDFFQKKSFPGPTTPISGSDSDRVLLDSDARILRTIQQDNTKVDRNPNKGFVETEQAHVAYSNTEDGTEFYSESVGSGPLKIVSLSRTTLGGLDTVLAVVNQGGDVSHSGAIHLNRLCGDQSFLAGDLKELP